MVFHKCADRTKNQEIHLFVPLEYILHKFVPRLFSLVIRCSHPEYYKHQTFPKVADRVFQLVLGVCKAIVKSYETAFSDMHGSQTILTYEHS